MRSCADLQWRLDVHNVLHLLQDVISALISSPLKLTGTSCLFNYRVLFHLFFFGKLCVLIYKNIIKKKLSREWIISAVHLGLPGPTCQSLEQGQRRKWWCTISQESSQLRRIFVLDTENLCSISISEEMGPGEACVALHLSWVAVPKAPALVHSITPLPFDEKPLHFAISRKLRFSNIPSLSM